MLEYQAAWMMVSAPVLAFVGYLGVSVRRLTIKLENTMSEPQVRHLISDKMDVARAEHVALTQRIKTLELKIDKLIELSLVVARKDLAQK